MEPIEWIAVALALAGVFGDIWTNKKNEDLMREQMSWNEKMMDKQNEYNSPRNQMSRMEEAGINTAMMGESGVGSVFNTSASHAPNPLSLIPMSNPFSQFPSDVTQSVANYAKGKRDLTLMEAEKERILTDVAKMKQEITSLGLSNSAQEILNRYLDARETWAINGMKSNVELNYAQSAYFKGQLKEVEYRIENILPEELQKIISEKNVNVMDVNLMLAQIKDYYASAELKTAQKGLVESQDVLTQAQTHLTETEDLQTQTETGLVEQESEMYHQIQDKYLEKMDAEIKNLGAQTNLSEEQTYWKAFEVVGNTDKHNMKYATYTKDRANWRNSVRKKFKERVESK